MNPLFDSNPIDKLVNIKKMKRILVPCDFSKPAQEAYQFAIELAGANHSEVIVMKAIDLPVLYEGPIIGETYVFDPPVMVELEAEAKKEFEHLQKIHAGANVKSTFIVRHGSVASMIRKTIEDMKPDLVIMGTHGASGWAEYLIGSNTEKIVRHSKVPVLAIRKAPHVAGIKNIVLPTSLELDQHEFMAKIKELQSLFRATLHIVVINTPYNLKRSIDEQELLQKYTQHYKLKDFTLNTRNGFDESEGIIQFAQEIKADLLVMATHARKGLAHFISGSVAEDVVNHIDCPIWTFSLGK